MKLFTVILEIYLTVIHEIFTVILGIFYRNT